MRPTTMSKYRTLNNRENKNESCKNENVNVDVSNMTRLDRNQE